MQCDPDLGEDLPAEHLAVARRHVLAEVVNYPTGTWRLDQEHFDRVGNLGLLLIDGMLVREVTVGEYTCSELLGPGDVLQPWLHIGPDDSVATEVGWHVAQKLQLAILDRKFCERAIRWPEITAAICRRLTQRVHWLAFHLAVCGHRRIDDRLLLVLWHFADRWGTMTSEGVRLDVRLTHDVLASVIGARRPSVSVALGRLIDEGRLRSRPRSRWLLLGGPPPELSQVHEAVNLPRSNGRKAQ